MRINIVMNDAIRLSGAKSKREAVELAIKSLIELKRQESIKKLRGKLNWEGNLDEMRSDR